MSTHAPASQSDQHDESQPPAPKHRLAAAMLALSFFIAWVALLLWMMPAQENAPPDSVVSVSAAAPF